MSKTVSVVIASVLSGGTIAPKQIRLILETLRPPPPKGLNEKLYSIIDTLYKGDVLYIFGIKISRKIIPHTKDVSRASWLGIGNYNENRLRDFGIKKSCCLFIK